MTTPIRLGQNREATLRHAYASYLTETTKDLTALTAAKIEALSAYDAAGMDRAVAICYWGRSGSFLLASYLDGHDDVLMLPQSRSQWIYPFLEQFSFLSLREKLIAYPDFAEAHDAAFFHGSFAINEMDYYAAISALFQIYGNLPSGFLDSRRGFFVFLHVAYSLALNRRPATHNPLMVYAHHRRSELFARQFVEDFPKGYFLHTVRDPITTIDSWFDTQLRFQTDDMQFARRSTLLPSAPSPMTRYIDPAWWVLTDVMRSDRPHIGMDARTRAVRFEDLHLNTAETMSRVANWLGLAPASSLVRSTFNGLEWVVGTGPNAWSGARAEQVQRHSRNMFIMDRAILFVLFNENYERWGYPRPAVFTRPWARRAITTLMWLLPMKMEATVISVVMRKQILHALGHGKLRFPVRVLARLVSGRISTRRLIRAEVRSRLAGGVPTLTLL